MELGAAEEGLDPRRAATQDLAPGGCPMQEPARSAQRGRTGIPQQSSSMPGAADAEQLSISA